MLSPTEIAEAARTLAQRRQQGEQGARLPAALRPSNLDDALAVQAAVTTHLDERIGGWKCGLPSEGKLVIAPIHASVIHATPICPAWERNGAIRVEPELAFILGRDLPARATPYSRPEVDAAIASTRLALEVIDCRYETPAEATFPELLADGLFNQGLVLGPAVDNNHAHHANELIIKVSKQGNTEEYAGRHPAPLPREPLYWLANFFRSRGQGLKTGDVVITGSYAGVLSLPINEGVDIQFGELGMLSVSFISRK